MESESTPEEEYENWRANSGYLYDRLVVNQLKWPALSFEWLPTFQQTEGGVLYDYIYTSNSSGEEQEYIYVAQVQP